MHRVSRPTVIILTCTVLAAVACKPAPEPSAAPEPAAAPESSAAAPTPEPASAPDQRDPSTLPSGTVSESLISTTSVVKAIDHDSREVTLESPDGTRLTFIAGDEVRNLDQVNVGDEVTAEYYESVAYEVKKAGAAAVGEVVEEAATTAAPGEMPAGAGYRVTVVTTTIAAIDKASATVVLEDADGERTTVKVRDPKKLDHVAVGDLVEISLTEAVAVSVTPADKPEDEPESKPKSKSKSSKSKNED